MTKTRRHLVAAMLGACVLESGLARADCTEPVGLLASIESSVQIQRSDAPSWQKATLNDSLCQGDTIRVGPRSRAALKLVNDQVLRLDQNTTLRLLDIAQEPAEPSLLELLEGALQSFSRKPRHLAVNTPYLNGLIEGTEFIARVEHDRASLLVLEGKVKVENEHGGTTVGPGHAAVAERGAAPVDTLVARPRDAVQWALHYPAVLAGSGTGGGHVGRAAELLQVGRVDEAAAELQAVATGAPEQADALALSAVIAVAQNRREDALRLAQDAVRAAPDSAGAQIALSYAQQSAFDLEGALASVESAARLAPDNALVWARLAELQSSFGRTRAALDAAARAESIDPNLSRTRTVLGFARLLGSDMSGAREAFEAAIGLDSSDPLPRLGLGLARIASGELAAGRGEIDIAAGLDPNQAIIRSYLGKAYFEEKRAPLDTQQFEIAAQLDPHDPTPRFYRALALQTENRPGEALEEMRRAIALNGDRAVYRSRLLLDSDLAARSASMARVYTDLGFQPLALVEGWKSVNTDPASFSAHRFLADSYAVLPQHEIARVSELLQSQLMQPLSMTPIQPHLAESDLFLVSGGGPGVLSFNEFNPLFRRDGHALQASVLGGSNDTASGEAVVSGIGGKLAYSLGAFHFESDGFRDNADQDDDIFNAFVQAEISPATSVQAEYRYRDTDVGDMQLHYFEDENRPGYRTPFDVQSLRLGARHDFAPGSTLLASAIYSDADYEAFDAQPPIAPLSFIGQDEPQDALGGELQHLWRTQRMSLTWGGGYFDRSSEVRTTALTVLPPPFDDIPIPDVNTDLQHANVYGYMNLRAHETVTVTLGLSGEFADAGSDTVAADDAEYNPKLGLLWTPVDGTLVRLAAFRTTKRPVIANQTLEPTQVAGFNQFFDDFNQTQATRYGIALDQALWCDAWGGIELSQRDLEVPAADQFGTTLTADWQDDLARAYLFWLPHPQVALRAEFEYEEIERDIELTDGVKKAKTGRLPLGVSWFHPSGFGASLDATYVDQEGSFERLVNGRLRHGSDEFWLVDTSLRYRLPGRHGILSLTASNLLDEDFLFFDTDFTNPRQIPERVITGGFTLAFP